MAPLELDPRLRQYATPRQAEIFDAVREHGSHRKAAKALGIGAKTVDKRMAEIRKKASLASPVQPRKAVPTAPVLQSCTGPAHPPIVHESPKLSRRILVIPDVHVPYHDVAAWDLTVRVAHEMQPDLIVIIGDFIDCYSVSQFAKDPRRKNNLQWELDAANVELDKLAGASEEMVLTVGNHEFRIDRYIHQRAPELDGMISVEEYLRAKERRMHWVPYKDFYKVGKVAFTHEVGHCGKHAAANSLASFGGNLVFGHTHRATTIYGGTVDGDRHFCMNVGWLGDPGRVDYMHRSQIRDWQHGFGWIDQDGDGNSWAQFCPIVDGRVVVQGKVFS